MRRVFISFWFRRDEPDGPLKGFGNAQIECTKPICTLEDLENLSAAIMKEHGYSNIVILQWRDFDPEELLHEN